jgi:2-oxoglutarate ferredoxin oxidoreductase subunit alpha
VRAASRRARAEGRAFSSLVLKTLWPVPRAALRGAVAAAERVLVAELNLGQYRREVERALPGVAVQGLNRVDGETITPDQILEAL